MKIIINGKEKNYLPEYTTKVLSLFTYDDIIELADEDFKNSYIINYTQITQEEFLNEHRQKINPIFYQITKDDRIWLNKNLLTIFDIIRIK